MAAFVWAAASAGNWSVGGNWKVGGVAQSNPPTTSDTVTFGAGTGFTQSNCILDTTGNVSTIIFTGYTGTFTTSGQTLNVSGATVTFVSGMTLTGNGTSVITCNGATVAFDGGTLSFPGTVNLTGSGTVTLSSVNTFVNLNRTGTAVTTDILSVGANQTVTGTFTLAGNSATNRLLVQSSVLGTARTLALSTTGSATVTNVDFSDAAFTGTNTPVTGTSLGDALGNSGITFNSPLTLYRVGANGNWSDSVYSLSSGGTTGQRVPLPQDTVNVDSGASGTATIDMPRLGKDINFTGFTGTCAFNLITALFGSLTLASGMSSSGISTVTFQGRSSHNITTSGLVVTFNLQLNTPTGTYTLQDNLNTNRTFAGAFTLTLGTFTDNGKTVTFSGVVGGGFSMTGGVLNASGPWNFNLTSANFWSVTGGTVNASSQVITLLAATATTRTFKGGGGTYGTFTYIVAGSTGTLAFTGSNILNTINFSDATTARTLTLANGTTTTVTNFNVNGTSVNNRMTLNSDSAGLAATISATGTIAVAYLAIKDSTTTGGAEFTARHSVNTSGNSGWVFTEGLGLEEPNLIVGSGLSRSEVAN